MLAESSNTQDSMNRPRLMEQVDAHCVSDCSSDQECH